MAAVITKRPRKDRFTGSHAGLANALGRRIADRGEAPRTVLRESARTDTVGEDHRERQIAPSRCFATTTTTTATTTTTTAATATATTGTTCRERDLGREGCGTQQADGHRD